MDDDTIDRVARRIAEYLRGPKHRQRNCKHCARPFIPTDSRQKYCCPEHAQAAAQTAYRRRQA